jgi:hypothetical protein
MSRRLYDASGVATLDEQQTVRIRQGRYKGQVGRLQYIRRTTGHPRIYVSIRSGVGTWLSPRSIDVLA